MVYIAEVNYTKIHGSRCGITQLFVNPSLILLDLPNLWSLYQPEWPNLLPRFETLNYLSGINMGLMLMKRRITNTVNVALDARMASQRFNLLCFFLAFCLYFLEKTFVFSFLNRESNFYYSKRAFFGQHNHNTLNGWGCLDSLWKIVNRQGYKMDRLF